MSASRMRLRAISDLHVGYARNRLAIAEIEAAPGDSLILGGDITESAEQLGEVLDELGPRFDKLFWVPGNHELWTFPGEGRGVEKYERMVEVCQSRGVHTPEDAFVPWPAASSDLFVAPLMLLYDYSFRPDHVARGDALAWAAETGLVCADETRIEPRPYRSIDEWCADRCASTLTKLERLPTGADTVLINHFPLRYDLAFLPRIPRFSIWCGTRVSEDWHRRFRAKAVVSGHLHIRSRATIDRTTFHEVSLGYPKQWDEARGIGAYVRTIAEA